MTGRITGSRMESMIDVVIHECLSIPIAVKKHQDRGNFYKGPHLIGAGLQGQRFSLYDHGRKQNPGRPSTGGTKSSTSCSKGKQKEDYFTGRMIHAKKQHNHYKSHKRKHLIVTGLHF